MQLKTNLRHNTPYIVALLLLAVITWFIEQDQTQKTEALLHATLQEVSGNTQKNLQDWSLHQIRDAQRIANLPALRTITRDLLQSDTGRLDEASLHDALRQQLNVTLSSLGYLGFFVISPSGETISSMRDSNLTGQNLVARLATAEFRSAINGDSLVTAPMQSDVPVADASGDVVEKAATMFVLAPITGQGQTTEAVLALRINPYLEFSSIFARGRSGLTGETYAFNKDGVLISESRFNDQLQMIGLIRSDEASTLNIHIRDPGRNLLQEPTAQSVDSWPPTQMAEQAMRRSSGASLSPYRDYRGVPVIGAWLWDEHHGMGIATEIDAAEAYAALELSLATIRGFALAVAVLLITLGVYQDSARRKSHRQEKALLAAKVKAEKANRSKMEFLSAMSHDLRTPLNAVIGFSQLLAADEGIQGNQKHKDQIGYIERSGNHLLAMLNEILEFATIDMGEISYDFANVSPAGLLDDCLATISKSARERKITVRPIEGLESAPRVWTDEARARQILSNFLSNAVKYNRMGGSIDVEVTTKGDKLHIGIHDTGPGLTKEQISKLWQPFERLGAEKTKTAGTGIGLAFSKALAEGIGATVGVESEDRKGCHFWLSLPISQDQSKNQNTPHTPETDQMDHWVETLKNTRILYIEDVDINQTIVRSMLKKIDGLKLVTVDDGAQAMQAVKQSNFDVILADIHLPDTDGFTWNRERVAAGYSPDTPVIALSADAAAESRTRAQEEGMFGYIEKPVMLNTLLRTLSDAVSAKSSYL
jgi:signal transduction histidine kinase/ActR/RegA family two-component response regulator